MDSRDTIVALATPSGDGALAIIRVSGESAFHIVSQCLIGKERFLNAEPRYVGLYTFIDPSNKEKIDRITCVKYAGPRSFTGEDCVELVCHGGTVVVERLLEILLQQGCRYAMRGEFTRRGFENDKVDLAGAEAINQIIHSRSRAELQGSMNGYLGGNQEALAKWREKIETALRELETVIEFSDEDDVAEGGIADKVRRAVENMGEEVEKELEAYTRLANRRGAVRVCLAGPPNAGKSSVFNLILGFERCLVHYEAGTTRDVISENVVLFGGIEIRIVDTAGMRMTDECVEAMGVERSRQAVVDSDITVWVTAADEAKGEEEEKEIRDASTTGLVIGIINKIDVAEGRDKKELFRKCGIEYEMATALDEAFADAIVGIIGRGVERIWPAGEHFGIATNARQAQVLRGIKKEIWQIGNEGYGSEETVAYHLRRMVGMLDDFVGKDCPQEMMDKIFGEFCIGK